MGAIYTRKGDSGKTGLLGGSNVGKDSLRVSCYGTIDEANSALGLAHVCLADRKNDSLDQLKSAVYEIQNKLFTVGSELASDARGASHLKERVTDADVLWLEKLIDHFTEIAGETKSFVIPGETMCSTHLHVARSIIRRAERLVVQLARDDRVEPILIRYLNRLSDALFTLARAEVKLSFVENVTERVMRQVAAKADNIEETKSGEAISYELCLKLADASMRESQRIKVPVIICVSNSEGQPIFFYRMPNSLLVSIDIAMNKAYSAAVMRMDTATLGELAQPGASLYGINITNPRLVTFGGGFPLCKDGVVVGSLGISGGSVEEDCAIAQKALECWKGETNGRNQ